MGTGIRVDSGATLAVGVAGLLTGGLTGAVVDPAGAGAAVDRATAGAAVVGRVSGAGAHAGRLGIGDTALIGARPNPPEPSGRGSPDPGAPSTQPVVSANGRPNATMPRKTDFGEAATLVHRFYGEKVTGRPAPVTRRR